LKKSSPIGDAAAVNEPDPGPSRYKTASFTWPNIDLTTALKDPEKRKKFHSSPGMYAVLMGKKIGADPADDKDLPITFTYIDCSYLLLEKATVSNRSQSVDGLLFEVKITSFKPLVERDELMQYEPLVLNLER
jgi:hypothetical protein